MNFYRCYDVMKSMDVRDHPSKIFIPAIVFTVVLVLAPFGVEQSFALHLSEELKWQTVFITSNPTCSNYNYQIMETHDKITQKYLDLYGVANSKYDPICFSHWKYLEEYSSPPDLDLIIIEYDKNLGEQELHKFKMGGFYTHTGYDRSYNHAIVMCADCSSFYYSKPSWILTHELSHFVLFYKNYDINIIEDLVHSYDNKFDQCLEHYDSSCRDIATKIRVNAYDYSVMPIYEPAVIDKNPEEMKSDKTPDIVLHMAKEMTKWWAAGKITDGDYANAVGFVIDKDVISKYGNAEVLFTDGPIDDSITWDEILDNMRQNNADERSEKTIEEIKSNIPHIIKSEEQLIYADELISGLPEWFKTTAGWWAQDKISDKEFMKTVEYLRETGIIRSR